MNNCYGYNRTFNKIDALYSVATVVVRGFCRLAVSSAYENRDNIWLEGITDALCDGHSGGNSYRFVSVI